MNTLAIALRAFPKKRINAYLKDQLRRNNPFFIEIRKTEPVKLELQDLIDKYSKVGVLVEELPGTLLVDIVSGRPPS